MDSKRLILLSSLLLLTGGLAQAQDKADAKTSDKKDAGLNLFGDSGNAKGPTIITAVQQANFDSKGHTASFVGSVTVQDPQFSLTCDRLDIILEKDGGGLKQADADGNVFILSVRKDAKGGPDEKSTGKGDHATYTPKDGLIILTGSPQIQQGGNTHLSTEPGTKMFLYRDGHLKTQGGSRTVIDNSASPKKDGPN